MTRSLRSWLWRVPLDREVDEELALHIELRTRELVERGLDPKTARDIVLSRIGDLGQLKRTCIDLGRKREREMRLTRFIEEFRDDVRFAIRQLVRAPGFTAVAAITLALGIGVNAAIFALVDATLLRPLPVRDPDRLVMAWERSDTLPRSPVSPINMLDWNERSRTFERFGAFVPSVGGMVMAGKDGTAETVPRQWVSRDVFDVLGVTPVVGRTFRESDETRMKESGAVLLSEAFWRSRFDADPAAIGTQIRLDGSPFTIVGVLPEAAQLVGRTSMWGLLPIRYNPQARGGRGAMVIGRMKPGVTVDAARADMTSVADGLARDFPNTNQGWSVTLEPLHEALTGSDLRRTSLVLLGVVGFVLLICCANVANLLLARATARTNELAIRAALGAGRRRVIRQLLTESVVLAVLGGAAGIAVGAAILAAMPSLLPPDLLPGSTRLAFDLRVVAFCASAAILVGLLFGLAPAWHAREFAAAQGLAGGMRTTTAAGGRARSLLVVGEVATAVVLLFGGGLLLRTLLAIDNVDRGYHQRSALSMLVDPIDSRYPSRTELLDFYAEIEREIRSTPTVQSVAWASTQPLGDSNAGTSSFAIVGDPPVDERQQPSADFQIVSPSFFTTLEVPIVAGRHFDERDTETSPPVCIVNEAFVRKHLQGRSPIGVRVAIRSSWDSREMPTRVREIVGVAHQVKDRLDAADDFVQLYVPLSQDAIGDIYLLVQPASGRAEDLTPSVRAAIGRVDKEQLVSVRDFRTLEDIEWTATSRHRFRAVMALTFAGLALLLAMVGVFGVLGYAVQQRSREFGVRMALGATGGNVVRLVIGSASRLVLTGMVIGLVLAIVSARTISTFLFGVPPLDPLTFGAVAVLLAVTASIAVAVPALRALRVDPVEAFRAE